jgi:hypothetical protein
MCRALPFAVAEAYMTVVTQWYATMAASPFAVAEAIREYVRALPFAEAEAYMTIVTIA